ncbi:hypothetical protein [Pseudomonas solani]|uniref:hypothetical protein n=1 Tax=Pseudomonas solani TaxID=2731552 RepID=UPI003D6C0BAE
MKTSLPWLAPLLAICLGVPLPCAAQRLAAENHRVGVQVLDPDAPAVGTWRVKVHATYRPLVEGSPNTTETTTSRANCPSSRFSVPSLKRCTRTWSRTVWLKLPAAQVVTAGPHALDLDFAPVIEDHGGTFRIDSLALEYMTCAKGCEIERVDIPLSCYADDTEPGEVLAAGLLLSYSRGAKAAREVAECGLKVGREVGWANRETVMARVRGHFGDEQRMVSSELLNAFPAIPGADHRWRWNPATDRDLLDDRCPLPANQSYVNSTYFATLPVATGWPYRHEAEVYVTSKPNGEVCNIWLTGTGDEMYLRYFYSYQAGTLIQAATDGEADRVSREWRWANREPWEYTRRRMPDSVAGHDAILYWHRTAAEQWPKRMDYTPDFEEFKALNAFSQQLLERFPAK